MQGGPDANERRAVRMGALAALLVAASVVLLWPIPARLGSTLAGGPGDNYIFAWNIWWFREALWHLHADPFHTPMLLHPHGASLAYHTTTLASTVPGSLAALVLPLPIVFNGLVVFHFAAAAFVVFGLARSVLRRAGFVPATGPALFAAAAYSFAPFHVAHVGHLNILAVWPVPAAGWAALRLVDRPSVRRACWLGAALGAAVWADGYHALAASLLVGAIFVAAWRGAWPAAAAAGDASAQRGDAGGRHGRTVLVKLAAAVVAPLVVLAAPVVTPMLGRGRAGVAEVAAVGGHDEYVADLLSWVVPSPFHPVWGDAVAPLYARFTGNLAESVVFPTFTVLVLALVAWRRRDAWARGWLVIALVFVVLSLGPFLHVAGRDGFEVGGHVLRLPLPKALLDSVPWLAGARAAGRFASVAQLGLALAACLGLAHWAVRRRGAVALAAAAFGLEAMAWPLGTTPLELPAAYRALVAENSTSSVDAAGAFGRARARPGAAAVLEIPPVHARDKVYQLYQTAHGLPLLGGRLARLPANAFDGLHADPFLARLGRNEPWTAHDGLATLAGLDSLDVRWVVLHRELRAAAAIERVLSRRFERRAMDATTMLFERVDAKTSQ